MGFKKEGEKKTQVTPLENGEVSVEETITIEDEEELVVGSDERSVEKKIEEKRLEQKEAQKKLRIQNYIVLGIALVVVVVALALAMTLGNKEGYNWVTILVFCIAIASFIGIYIFSKFQKKSAEKSGNEYVGFIFNEKNKVVYNDSKFTDLSFSLKGEEDIKELFNESRIFLNIKSFKAINVVKGKLNDVDFVSFDCAASILEKRRPIPHFLGRMFVFNLNDVDSSLRGIYQIKGGEYSFKVDDIEDLTLIDGNDKHTFYANNEEIKKILNSKVLNIVKKIKPSTQVIDVIVSINNSKLFIGIDYSDDMINPPLDKSLNLKNLTKEKKDIETVIEIIEAINK